MKLARYLYLHRVSDAAFARQIGVTTNAVRQWRVGDRPIPAERLPTIERLTGGKVRCEDEAPQVEWRVLIDRGKRLARAA